MRGLRMLRSLALSSLLAADKHIRVESSSSVAGGICTVVYRTAVYPKLRQRYPSLEGAGYGTPLLVCASFYNIPKLSTMTVGARLQLPRCSACVIGGPPVEKPAHA